MNFYPMLTGYIQPMIRSTSRRLFSDIISCAFIMLFVYAALVKLLDYENFTAQLGQSPMLTRMAGTVTWIVPSVELILVVLLVFERTRTVGLYASLGLMVMFTTYIVLIRYFSPYVPCSCGGVISAMTWDQHLVFNLSFVSAGWFAIMIQPALKIITPRSG